MRTGSGFPWGWGVGASPLQLDVLDTLLFAAAIQGEPVADHLHDLAAGALGQLLGRLARGEVAAVLHAALDELMGLKYL